MQIISDEKLIEQYLKGDEESLEVLIKRYLNLVFGFVLKYVNNQQTAEDITQEVFLKAWRNLKKLDKKQSFKSWLFTIAKNSSLDFLKKKNPVLFSRFENEKGENALINNLRDKSDLPDKIAEMSFVKSIFDGAIEKMSLKYREVFSLYYNKELNFQEIAEKIGEPLNTVKSRHRRGLAILKKLVIVK